MYAVKPRYNEPRYNEFFDITNIIRKPKRKIYLDITNYNVNTGQKINSEQINSLNKFFNPYGKETATLSVYGLLYVINNYIGTVVFPEKSPVLQITH